MDNATVFDINFGVISCTCDTFQEIMKGAALKWNGLTVKAKDVSKRGKNLMVGVEGMMTGKVVGTKRGDGSRKEGQGETRVVEGFFLGGGGGVA